MLYFILKESIFSIKKAKGSFFISLISTSISIFLITLSYFLFDIAGAVEIELKNNIVLNAFISDTLDENGTEALRQELGSLNYISEVTFISKQQAQEDFIKASGEDFRKILDYNPLPASFKISINEKFVTSAFLKTAFNELSGVRGIDEIVYENEAAEKIFTFIDQIKKYVLLITVIILFISVYIIYSTSKLILKSRTDEMETMKLIGARISSVKMPVIINSALTGLFAGIISLIIFSLFISSSGDYINLRFSYKINYMFLLSVTIIMGPLLGAFISYLTLRKISLKI